MFKAFLNCFIKTRFSELQHPLKYMTNEKLPGIYYLFLHFDMIVFWHDCMSAQDINFIPLAA